MSDYFQVAPPPAATGASMDEMVQSQVAAWVPGYLVADLPSASAHPNGFVKILDNPQGQAFSNGTLWISDVDGSSLGPGHE